MTENGNQLHKFAETFLENCKIKSSKLFEGCTIEMVSKELNHFGVIAGLFQQIGGHSSRFVLFLKIFHYKNDQK